MRGPHWFVLASCSVAMMFASSVVRAGGSGTIEGGTIRFAGAIVEPTCSIGTEPDSLSAVASAARTRQSYQRTCSDTSSAAVNASRIYSVDVVHLSNSEPDQVLRYFASYVRAAQSSGADPVLVTQTYE
jgi:type 1 fimbria pilin